MDKNGLLTTLKKSNSLIKRTDFISNVVIINNAPAWNNFDEGKIVNKLDGSCFAETCKTSSPPRPSPCREGSVSEVLIGNIRIAFRFDDIKNAVSHVNGYYPFGMNIKELSVDPVFTAVSFGAFKNEYKFNGKMIQDEMGLGWLDYRRRMYDLQLERWHSVDPLAEKMRRWSPYTYAFDNPMRFIDIDGMIPWPLLEKYKGFTRWHENNFGAPREGGKRTHKGVDMNFKGAGDNDKGAPILSTHDGIVVKVTGYKDDKDAGGNRITIRSQDGTVETTYMHLNGKPDFKVGARISEGQQIGEMGKTGRGNSDEFASHLHYEIHTKNEDGSYSKTNPIGSDGQPIDPQQMLNSNEKFSNDTQEVGISSNETSIGPSEYKMSDRLHDRKVPILKTLGDILQGIGF